MFDEFGPELIIEVYNPKVGMHGFLIIDSSARGPGKGGIRMTPTLDKEEVFRLARTMTWKNALANLPFGGAKSGIIADPKLMSKKQKDSIIAEFSKALKIVCPEKYVAAPDINTAEHEMEVFAKANGSKKSCTGKPKKMGGIPHELGSTGFGVFHSALVAVSHLGWDIKEKTVAVEGFGNVGSFVAKFISESGAKLVAVSDSKGVIYNKGGIGFKKLDNIKSKLNSENRLTILRIKYWANQMNKLLLGKSNGHYKIYSPSIYEAVLDNNISTIDEFIEKYKVSVPSEYKQLFAETLQAISLN